MNAMTSRLAVWHGFYTCLQGAEDADAALQSHVASLQASLTAMQSKVAAMTDDNEHAKSEITSAKKTVQGKVQSLTVCQSHVVCDGTR
jgi:Skp family chaperone for outer membrane proteins